MLSDSEFHMLLDYLDRPWSGFRRVRKGVKKRLGRHMHALGCPTTEAYIDELSRHAAARVECERCLQVTISRFFRDRSLWRTLQTRILPDLIHRFAPPVRIWSAGCAGGEEPYSLAMVWNETAPGTRPYILATDCATPCLDRARRGVYPRSSLKDVPQDLVATYFRSHNDGRQRRIRHHRLPPIRWHRHDLRDSLREPGHFHLILLRNNLLTYYRGASQRTALDQILARLAQGGVLVVGAHERLPPVDATITGDAACPWVYRRNDR